jgi:hypothetical protein
VSFRHRFSVLVEVDHRSSLLLGVDEERKEIICGLVDTIGMF